MTSPILLVGDSYTDQNLYYKTHFLAGDPFIYAEADDRALLVVSSMEQSRADKESIVHEVRSFDDYGYLSLARELGDRNLAMATVLERILADIGVREVEVSGLFPVIFADALRAAGITLAVNPELLVPQRRHKSPDEIEALAEAQRITERVTGQAIEIIARSEDFHGVLHYEGIPLTSERLRAEIEVSFTRDGMDTSLSPIVAGGPGAGDPHWEGAGPLRIGEAIVLDIFPRSKRTRYFADMTRTVIKGEPTDTLRRMYDAVLRAQETALGMIRAGVNGRDVNGAVMETLAQTGFADESGPRMIHSTGHGLGLDIHERPNIAPMDVELQEGDVVTVEPGLYDPHIGGIRIEDVVVVAANGCRNLTSFPKQFVI